MLRDVTDPKCPDGPLFAVNAVLLDCSWCGAAFVKFGSFVLCPACDVGEDA